MNGRGWWICAIAGTALIAADVVGHRREDTADLQLALLVLGSGLVLATGCALWALRPDSRIGPLIVIWPLAALVADLATAYPYSGWVHTLAIPASAVAAPVFAWATLSYPSGRLGSNGLRAFVLVTFVASFAVEVPYLLYFDYELCWWCDTHANSLLFRGDPGFSFVDWSRRTGAVMLAIAAVYVLLMSRKLAKASPGARRTLLPLAAASVLGAALFGSRQVALATAHFGWLPTIDRTEVVVAIAVPLALAIGVVSTRRARGPRGALGDLLLELGQVEPGGVRDALARAVGDPTLEIALWLSERRQWVDEAGQSVALPEGGERAVTFVGEGIAAVIHDPALTDQRGLVEAAGAAARLALENERLQAELRAQLAELRASRARVTETADAERRRLERDLHDGAQQRLLGLGLALQLARARAQDGSEMATVIEEAEAELHAALHELRELARGIYPAILVDQGLVPAIQTLVDKAHLPVEVSAIPDRLPAPVEATAYFVVAEALANVRKYSGASRAWIDVERDNGCVRVAVRDDGAGGADPRTGTGLRGLSDRVGALDGSLVVESPTGGGTQVVAEIPCG